MRRALIPCFVCAVFVAQPSHAQETADPAAQLYQEGADFASQGKWQDARAKFEAAVALRATPVGLFNLAQAERNLGLIASAKRHFVSARALAEREGADDVRRLSDDALAAVATRVPRVRLSLPRDAAGVEARVDSRPAEIVGGELELDPGPHDVTISAAGEKPFSRKLTAVEGTRIDLVVRFERDAPPPAATPPAPKSQPRSPAHSVSSSGPPAGAVVLAGVGAAALVVGVIFQVRRNDKLDEAAAGCTRTGSGWQCPKALENDPNHQDLKDQAASAGVWRNVALGVGASALVAGGVWWALGSSSSESRAVALSVQPSIQGAAARVRWAF
ncbi:MAG: hypothetical protein IPI67_13915 [Myxococcales bacterium]|nr:hypothetical protein [Myxococcales bacterium]